ncbi:MAG: hypothetical protein ABI912_04535, partial [Actinomycetota bacterium]
GARAVIRFSGSSVQLLAATGPDAGTATIRLDATTAILVDLYRPRSGMATIVYSKTRLKAGAHTLTVTATGARTARSRGTWVRLDAVKAGATLLQETSAAWTTTFRRVATSAASLGSYDTEHQIAAGDNGGKAAYQSTFYGSGITVYVTKTAASGSADVLIDGRKVGSIDLYSPTAKYKVAAFTKTLANGQHTITISLTGTKSAKAKGTDVGVDYLIVK